MCACLKTEVRETNRSVPAGSRSAFAGGLCAGGAGADRTSVFLHDWVLPISMIAGKENSKYYEQTCISDGRHSIR